MNFLIFQNLAFAIWIISLGITIIWIKRSSLDSHTKALWTLIVLIFPYLGSLAFIVVHRLESKTPADKSAR
jgi:hypothetical protein